MDRFAGSALRHLDHGEEPLTLLAAGELHGVEPQVGARLRACNQSTSRDPVVAYDETTIVEALGRLRDRELVRFVKPTMVRVVKYHQRLEESLALDPDQAALITVLLLRGAQTPGELRPRTERLQLSSIDLLITLDGPSTGAATTDLAAAHAKASVGCRLLNTSCKAETCHSA